MWLPGDPGFSCLVDFRFRGFENISNMSRTSAKIMGDGSKFRIHPREVRPDFWLVPKYIAI